MSVHVLGNLSPNGVFVSPRQNRPRTIVAKSKAYAVTSSASKAVDSAFACEQMSRLVPVSQGLHVYMALRPGARALGEQQTARGAAAFVTSVLPSRDPGPIHAEGVAKVARAASARARVLTYQPPSPRRRHRAPTGAGRRDLDLGSFPRGRQSCTGTGPIIGPVAASPCLMRASRRGHVNP